ncbi:hypothetical protein CEUSTIGMA_g7973.t1 [Chlamydomonas eustigma]|uniref:Armadillo repeat-containing domain-containing protein n=1 Tax=Chlamydomonas eustigma TaxID=1157962 RepID=A0A250XBT2_9CHLO|nr:hypothetical protein CEUSTIGMA_g7973.t1 [Chlamydomonas eustigma]|eukprot:GAX80535.1 hypothetical protein CEUSTIGMA_g7973.t1 [Chlamydomonas eustigma]
MNVISPTSSGRKFEQLDANSGTSYAPAATVDNQQPVFKPSEQQIQEMHATLKVKTSMMAVGACERVKKFARVFPKDIAESPILSELINIVVEGPMTPLAGAAMSALAAMAMSPDGRQFVCTAGGTAPIIKLISEHFPHPNVDRALTLLMNLSADQVNRKQVREEGGVEALVSIIKISAMDSVMEHAMGTLHNVMLTDIKAKMRAVEAGVAYGLARVLAARLPPNNLSNVRCRMLVSDLLQVPDLHERIQNAAAELGLKLPEAEQVHNFKKNKAMLAAAPALQPSQSERSMGSGANVSRMGSVAGGLDEGVVPLQYIEE